MLLQGDGDRHVAGRASVNGSPACSPRQGPSWAPPASMPVHIKGAASRVYHPRDTPAAHDRRVSASGSVDGAPALGPREISLSEVQIGRDAVGPDGKASPMNSEHAASMASSHADEQPRGRQMWASRDARVGIRAAAAAEESRLSLGSASSPPGPTPFGAAPHQSLAPPIVGMQLQKQESVGESTSVGSSELPERPLAQSTQSGQRGQSTHPAQAPRRPPALKLGSSNTQDSPIDFEKLTNIHGRAHGSGSAAAGGAGDHAASGDANADSLMDAVAGPSDIPAGDAGPTAGGEAELNGTSMGDQSGNAMSAVVSALKTGAANVARDAPDALSSAPQPPQPGETRSARDARDARRSAPGEAREAQLGGLPPRGAMHAKAGNFSSRAGGDSPRIANISECAPLETPGASLMSVDEAPYPGPGRLNRDDGAEWPPPMTNAGRRRLKRPIMVLFSAPPPSLFICNAPVVPPGHRSMLPHHCFYQKEAEQDQLCMGAEDLPDKGPV